MPHSRGYTPEFKAKITLELLTGNKTAAELSQKYSIDKHLIGKWKRWMTERGSVVFEKNKVQGEISGGANIVIGDKPYLRKLKEIRMENGYSQSDIGKVLGISQDFYSKYENGAVELPIRRLMLLCEFYGVSSDYMLGITDNRNNA